MKDKGTRGFELWNVAVSICCFSNFFYFYNIILKKKLNHFIRSRNKLQVAYSEVLGDTLASRLSEIKLDGEGVWLNIHGHKYQVSAEAESRNRCLIVIERYSGTIIKIGGKRKYLNSDHSNVFGKMLWYSWYPSCSCCWHFPSGKGLEAIILFDEYFLNEKANRC